MQATLDSAPDSGRYLQRMKYMEYWSINVNMFNIALISIAVVLFFATASLFILNRSSEAITSRVIPAIIVGLVGAFLTILFSLKENKVQETAVGALIAHEERMTPLEEIKHDYHRFYGGDLFSPRCFINPIKGQDLFDFHFNLITTEIVHCVFGTFQAFKTSPEVELVSSSGYPKSLCANLKRTFVTWEDYICIFKDDTSLFDALNQFNPEQFKNNVMTVPSKTEISYSGSSHEKSITFRNEFVTFAIRIHRWNGSRRIAEWKWILNLDEGEKDDYWISKFIIEQEIRSNRFRSGHPMMEEYENWSKEILTRIKDKYDYEEQLRKAIEYYHHFGDEVGKKQKGI